MPQLMLQQPDFMLLQHPDLMERPSIFIMVISIFLVFCTLAMLFKNH